MACINCVYICNFSPIYDKIPNSWQFPPKSDELCLFYFMTSVRLISADKNNGGIYVSGSLFPDVAMRKKWLK